MVFNLLSAPGLVLLSVKSEEPQSFVASCMLQVCAEIKFVRFIIERVLRALVQGILCDCPYDRRSCSLGALIGANDLKIGSIRQGCIISARIRNQGFSGLVRS